jgi:hypothetical protein
MLGIDAQKYLPILKLGFTSKTCFRNGQETGINEALARLCPGFLVFNSQ